MASHSLHVAAVSFPMLLALAPTSAQAANIYVRSELGMSGATDVLVDANPLFAVAGGEAGSTLVRVGLESDDGDYASEFVRVEAVLHDDATLEHRPRGISLDLQLEGAISWGPNREVFSGLLDASPVDWVQLTTAHASRPGPAPYAAQFRLIVKATPRAQLGPQTIYIRTGSSQGTLEFPVSIQIVPVPRDGAVPECLPSLDATSKRPLAVTTDWGDGSIVPPGPNLVPAIPSAATLQAWYAEKMRRPGLTMFERMADLDDSAIEFGVAKSLLGLTFREAEIEVTNSTDWDKQVIPFEGSTCAEGTPVTVKKGETRSIKIDADTASTLLLRREVCNTPASVSWILGPPWFIPFCLSKSYDSLAIFGQGGFWRLVGGRKLRIEFTTSYHEIVDDDADFTVD